jgi:hypothetical protein
MVDVDGHGSSLVGVAPIGVNTFTRILIYLIAIPLTDFIMSPTNMRS